MVPEPVSHPSDVEMRELRAISGDLICRAACVGYASSCFHGYRVAAIRAAAGDAQRVDLYVHHTGELAMVSDSAPTRSVETSCHNNLTNQHKVRNSVRLVWSKT